MDEYDYWYDDATGYPYEYPDSNIDTTIDPSTNIDYTEQPPSDEVEYDPMNDPNLFDTGDGQFIDLEGNTYDKDGYLVTEEEFYYDEATGHVMDKDGVDYGSFWGETGKDPSEKPSVLKQAWNSLVKGLSGKGGSSGGGSGGGFGGGSGGGSGSGGPQGKSLVSSTRSGNNLVKRYSDGSTETISGYFGNVSLGGATGLPGQGTVTTTGPKMDSTTILALATLGAAIIGAASH